MLARGSFPIFGLILFTLLSSTPLTSCSKVDQPRVDKPNIIVILTDDQPDFSIQYMPTVQTELVQKGVTFSNAYVTTPLCCPSRASILTGLFAHHHGVLSNRAPAGGATAFNDVATIAVWLHDAGYKTALMGKYLNDYNELPEGYIPPGWDEWHTFMTSAPGQYFYFGYSLNENGKIVQYSADPKDYSTDVLSAKAVEFIDQNADQPFFLMINPTTPHQPYYAADRHRNLFTTYETFSPYQPPNYFEADISDKPSWFEGLDFPTPDHVEGIYQRILRADMSVDDAVKQVVDALDENRIRDNTMIVYLSDNGMSLGNHRLIGKGCPYEECMHIPLVISYPDKITTPQVNSNFVLNIDLAPTFAELAGVPDISKFDGESFLPLLTDPNAPWRDGFFFEQFKDDIDGEGITVLVPSYVGFRTREWKFVQYETGTQELYDLVNDPYEMINIASQPGHEQVIEDMLMRIHQIRP
jgi:N-acetylglucosamine-6-sulfatase